MIQETFDLLRRVASTATLKTGRPQTDLIADRLVQACTQPTLLAAVERLMAALGCEVGYIGGEVMAKFLATANCAQAQHMLIWLRQYPRIAAMIMGLRDDTDYQEALNSVVLSDADTFDMGVALPGRPWPIQLTVECLSPLAHGADYKAGNATLYRRMQVLTTTGHVLDLPFYAGNAIRGQMRDLLADHMLLALGIQPNRTHPPLAMWFFHALYAGGVLEGKGEVSRTAIHKLLGNSGSIRGEGVHIFRDMLPALSLLGVALGDRILSGRLIMGDLRPRCREWGTGDVPVAELMEWTYLTRREDCEGHTEHHGMIANTECLRAGTVLDGGCQLDGHVSELEAAALAVGLHLLQQRGFLGAESRRGLGQVRLQVQGDLRPEPYLEHLAARKQDILDFLTAIGAFDTSHNFEQEEFPIPESRRSNKKANKGLSAADALLGLGMEE